MARNIELRSTFQFSGDGLGTLVAPQNQRPTPPQAFDTEIKESIDKNNYGVATLMSKAIFSALDDEMKDIASPYSSKRLASLINKGFATRSNTLSAGDAKASLEQFEFNTEHAFESDVKFKFCLREGAHKGHMILHVPAFIPRNELNVPAEATNFKLCARLLTLSDFEREGPQVAMCNQSLHAKVGRYETTMLPILRIPIQPLTTPLAIPHVATLPDNVSTVLVMGIKYYAYEKSRFSYIPEQCMMKIMRVQ